jgi:hydrogenase 3 maturation protease
MAWLQISSHISIRQPKVKSSESSLSNFWKENFERVAVVGIGNELNGDDAAGVLAARKISIIMRKRETDEPSRFPVFLAVEAGPAPEAFTGPLRRFRPDLVILIDAAELGEPPGAVQWLDWTMAEGMSASTHTLPPSLFAQFLVRELGCQVVLAGIQPKQLEFEREVSGEVMEAVDRVAEEVLTKINS